jgi:hypothetical protein
MSSNANPPPAPWPNNDPQSLLKLKALTTCRYFQALEGGQPWAIKLGLKNNLGYHLEGGAMVPAFDDVVGNEMRIAFVMPEPTAPVDITPPAANVYEGQAPDYKRPALSPPRDQTVRGPFGPWKVDQEPRVDEKKKLGLFLFPL